MSEPDPEPDVLDEVARAAEMRAGGHPWVQVARELNRPQAQVKTWPAEYPTFFADRYAAGMAAIREEAAAESIATLRTLLRSETERMKLYASRELLARAAPPTPAADKRPKSDFHRFADYLEGLTDEQLRKFLGDEGAGVAPRPGDVPALADGHPGPG